VPGVSHAICAAAVADEVQNLRDPAAKIGKDDSDMVESLAKEGKCLVAVPPGELVEVHFVR